MGTSEFPVDDAQTMEPLVGRVGSLEAAAEGMLIASRQMLTAASGLSSAVSVGAREWELTAEAVETGFLRALRRDALQGSAALPAEASSLLRMPSSRGIPGAGYGRRGARVTGEGERAELYGTIGGAIGYAVGGPVGALVGGMLGGLFGGDGDDDAQAREQERREWLNSPEGFEIQAYLYALAQSYAAGWGTKPRIGSMVSWDLPPVLSRLMGGDGRQVVVNMSPGTVQITGQGEESGARAARAFAGALGRVLRLNSVVVPAAGLGGEI